MLGAFLAVMGKIAQVTVSSDWGSDVGNAPPDSATSATRTLTVPVGNSGSLNFGLVVGAFDGTAQYSKNGGAFTTYTDGTDVTFANGDTLAFKALDYTVTGSMEVTVTDNLRGDAVGTWTLTVS